MTSARKWGTRTGDPGPGPRVHGCFVPKLGRSGVFFMFVVGASWLHDVFLGAGLKVKNGM